MSDNNNDKRLFLLDAMALIYRAYFGMIRNPLINSKGLNVSAISGFTNTLFELLSKEQPTHIAVVFDAFAPTERSVEYEFYKANRQETPTDIVQSIPWIKEIINGFKIPCIEMDGFEADDVIGTLAKKAEKKSYEVYMVTPDKDFGQLVSEKVYIYKPPYQGKGGFEKIGPEEVMKRWDIDRIEKVIDMLGLMGDSVDNIPGIAGVGEKTAAKLLKEFDSVEGIIENADQIKGKLQEKVKDGAEMAVISKKLATIHCDLPIELNEDKLIMEDPDREKLAGIFNDLEFRTIGKRILGDEFFVTVAQPTNAQMDLFGHATTAAAPVAKVTAPQLNALETKNAGSVDHEYICADTAEIRKKMVESLLKEKEFSFDTETTGLDPMKAGLVGVSFSCKSCEAYYIPIPEKMDKARDILEELRPLFEAKNILKIGQNIKYDMLVLRRHGMNVAGPFYDTMIAHYLIEPDMRHQMDFLAETYLGYSPVSIETLIGKKGKNQLSMRDVEIDKIVEYAAEDADITLQLKRTFDPMLKERQVEKLYYDVELPLLEVLSDMEYEGVALDTDFLNKYSADLKEQIKCLEDTVVEMAGVKFNLDSPKQLGEVLFVKLEIPYSGKKTKTGQYSTGEEILSKLAVEHEICGDILNYRELVKLKSTYVDSLPLLVNEHTGRIHTTYRQTVANTGRLSSQNPNLQNIPIKTERGREVRKAFIPRDNDHVLISADYSQIELRIIASLSKDKNMLEAFEQNLDIHSATAARVFGVPLEEVSREMRNKAKSVNFGIAYGQTAFGLSQTLNISRGEASDLISNYFKQYPGVKQYMDKAINSAREKGYAETFMSRKRNLSDINARNATVRGFAERNAINMPIQGTAADMIKVAMIDIHREMKKAGLSAKMTLQVHDELVFDVPKHEVEKIKPIIEDKMKNAIDLQVPIVVEMGTGENWLQAH